MAVAGALLPALATLPPDAILELVDSSDVEQALGATDLLPCPYCKVDKRKGFVQSVMRTRLPAGIGSEIGTLAAARAAAGSRAHQRRPLRVRRGVPEAHGLAK